MRSVGREVVGITLDNVEDLPSPCRGCAFWELDPVRRNRAEQAGLGAAEKDAWISATLLEWGSCGKLVYVDGAPAAFALYGPPAYARGANTFPTSPPSPDAVLLMTARVLPGYAGGGLGRVLIQHVAKDLVRRGGSSKALEAFGVSGTGGGTATGDDESPPPSCLVPAGFLLSVGFRTVRQHPRYPRLRLELKNAVSWREDVEVALERLLGARSPEPALRPI